MSRSRNTPNAWIVRMGLAATVGALMLGTMGCRYMTNRYYDFRDVTAMAVGVTSENHLTGIIPPSFGAYVEATDFLHLGAITQHGTTAELDLRGTGVYRENRTRFGLLCWQWLHDDQDYRDASYINYFKKDSSLWSEWMRDERMTFLDKPAKSLTYDRFRDGLHGGVLLLPRGWQYWEYVGAEVAISDPLVTHLGLTLRLGVDVSELSDFILGWFGVDFKADDMTPAMYYEKRHGVHQ